MRRRFREEVAAKMAAESGRLPDATATDVAPPAAAAPTCLGEAGRLVFHLAMAGGGGGSGALPAADQVVTECCICLTEDKDSVFIPCGHVCCCESCAKKINDSGQSCPICRASVTTAMKCFLV